MTSQIRAVLFDYGGTLDSDGLHWQKRFFSLYRKAGIEVPREKFAEAFYDSDDNLPKRFNLKGLDLPQTVRRQVECVLDHLELPRTKAEEIAEAFVRESREALVRNTPLLKRLSARYKLGIVSNFYGNLEDILRAEGLLELFGCVADSENVGVIKPDAELFLHATSGLGVKPEEAMMVGDNLRRDMAGAEALGMPHAWIDGGRPELPPCCGSVLRVSRFSELEAPLLGRETVT